MENQLKLIEAKKGNEDASRAGQFQVWQLSEPKELVFLCSLSWLSSHSGKMPPLVPDSYDVPEESVLPQEKS